MAFVDTIRKSFSRKRRRDVDHSGGRGSGAAEASAEHRDSITCIIAMLDESEASFEIERSSTVNDLLNDVAKVLSLQEVDYFGFSYTTEDGLVSWLHNYKSIAKQLPGQPPYRLTFGVKFYVAAPGQLREDVTRYQFCLQLRSDLYKRRVVCSKDELAEIAALSLQSELGDYDESLHVDGYERQYEFVPNQEGMSIYEQIVNLHKEQDGLLPFEAELRLLNMMQGFQGYGVRSFLCGDDRGQSLRIEISHNGLKVNHADTDATEYAWPTVTKITHRRKRVVCRITQEGVRPLQYQFHFPSKKAAKDAWKSILEHHDFFSMELPPPKPKFISSVFRGSTFRYSGRTQYQIKRMEDFQIRPNLEINRKNSVRRSNRKAPQRSASSASSRRTGVEITVARSHSLSGASKISSNGVKIPLEEMMRSRADHSLDNSQQDISLVATDHDQASMLVHLGTPAPSTANIPAPVYVTVPGGDDDLEPDYQELNNTLKLRNTHLEAESASLEKVVSAPSPVPSAGRASKSPTMRDPTTGEPMYNEIGEDLPEPAVPVATIPEAPECSASQYDEPKFERGNGKEKPAEPATVTSNVDIVVTLSSPKGDTMALTSTSSESPTEAQSASKTSLDKAGVPADEGSTVADSTNGTQGPLYSLPTPRHRRGDSDSCSSDDHKELTASQQNLISPDVLELMAELGIAEEEKDADGDNASVDDSLDISLSNEADGNEAADLDADPFAQPGITVSVSAIASSPPADTLPE